MTKMVCCTCGREIAIEQRNDLMGDLIRCRTVYRCQHCKRDLVYEERYV